MQKENEEEKREYYAVKTSKSIFRSHSAFLGSQRPELVISNKWTNVVRRELFPVFFASFFLTAICVGEYHYTMLYLV